MSYQVDGDGKVTFRCQGKDCGKTKEARSVKVLPKKWCISSVVFTLDHPESGGDEIDPEEQAKKAIEANQNLAGHFCSFKCAKNTFSDERVVAMVKKLRVAVVVFGDCKMVIDAENLDGGEGGDGEDEPAPKRPKGGSRDDDDSPRGVQPKGLDSPHSPPPFTLPEGSSPGF